MKEQDFLLNRLPALGYLDSCFRRSDGLAIWNAVARLSKAIGCRGFRFVLASVQCSLFGAGFPYQKPLSQMLAEPPTLTPTVETQQEVNTDVRIACSLGLVSS